MLDIDSPVPLTEGETIVGVITTKHAIDFVIGVIVASPLGGTAALLSMVTHTPPALGIVYTLAMGTSFAVVPWKGRTLAEMSFLAVRYALRPKNLRYDRADRVLVHRRQEGP